MKIIKMLIIIIIILGIILGFKIKGGNDNINTSSKMSATELMQLIKKGTGYDNLHIIENNSNGKVEKFIKDNILVTKQDEIFTWQNLNTNEIIVIKGNSAIKEIQGNKTTRLSKSPMETYLDSSKYKIEYVGEEKVDAKKCVSINIYNTENKLIANYALDKETGLPMRTEITANYTYSIGTVTDEDVKRPDMTNYTVIDLDEVG